MAVELATAYVALTVETKNIASEVSRGFDPVQKVADQHGKRAGKAFTGGMGTMFKGIAGLFGGAMAGLAVKDFLGDSLAEARESQKVGALTASIIRSTGGAAKVTTGQVAALAESISRKTGVDDEAIQTGANLLLTFKNVRNETGKGNDMFNQATAAALDLSKAGFGSVDGAAKMMGKALNDPIKGISALGRAGVTFTDQQKEQIKTLVETGDVLGAQKIIMQEVQSQVGGAAEATATAGDKAKVTLDNLKEAAGNKLLPIVDTLATKFTTLVEEWQKGTGTGGQLRDIFNSIVGAISAVVGWVQRYSDILLPLAGAILAIVAAIKVWSAVTKAYAVVQGLLNAVMMMNPIGLVILAIVALVAAIVIAWKKSETFRNIVLGVWGAVKGAIMAVVDWFRNTAWPWIKGVIDKNIQGFNLLRDKVVGAWDAVKAGLKAGWDWISRNVFDPIKTGIKAVQTAFEKTKDGIDTAWNKLKEIAKAPIKWIIQTVVGDTDKKGIIGAFNWLSDKIGGPHISGVKLPAGFKAGGVLPGYTPGRDVHHFISPTGGRLDLSGGEAIMRPEFTRLVGGKAGVDRLNAMARAGGLPFAGFAGGGIWDWVTSKASSVFAWVADKASDVYKAVTNPLDWIKRRLPTIPGGKTISEYGTAVVHKGTSLVVEKVKDLWNKLKSAFDSHGGAPGTGENARTVAEMTAVVKRLLPDTRISSGYRPGAITALGNTSQHAKGLAIDIVPHSMKRFDTIKGAFPHAYQLFYSPRNGQTLLNGRPWRMDPVTTAGHWDHIHLSNKRYAQGGVVPKPLLFDRGGVLPSGTSLVQNNTGGPEALFPGRGAVVINVEIALEQLAQLRTLEDFFELLERSRVNGRKVASGRVNG